MAERSQIKGKLFYLVPSLILFIFVTICFAENISHAAVTGVNCAKLERGCNKVVKLIEIAQRKLTKQTAALERMTEKLPARTANTYQKRQTKINNTIARLTDKADRQQIKCSASDPTSHPCRVYNSLIEKQIPRAEEKLVTLESWLQKAEARNQKRLDNFTLRVQKTEAKIAEREQTRVQICEVELPQCSAG